MSEKTFKEKADEKEREVYPFACGESVGFEVGARWAREETIKEILPLVEELAKQIYEDHDWSLDAFPAIFRGLKTELLTKLGSERPVVGLEQEKDGGGEV